MDMTRIDQLLGQMRAAEAILKRPVAAVGEAPNGGFAQALRSSIDQVNAVQSKAQGVARDFEMGVKGVELHEVMISMAKANVSFQQMVQVRNRLVSAYNDIMNMQV